MILTRLQPRKPLRARTASLLTFAVVGFCLLGTLASVRSAWGQATEVETKHSRGLSVPSAYQLDDLDAVNLFSGNLTVSVPLGLEYPASERLAYRFTLRTNSNVWHFEQILQTNPTGPQTKETVAEPDLLLSNAGLGWQLSFGRLWAPMTPPINDTPNIWLLIEGDGSRRRFTSSSLHSLIDPAGATVSYTRDGSYLRMTVLPNGDREVESPEGTVRVFKAGTGVISQIRDRFGNTLDFAYSAGLWTLTDSQGRTHFVRFHTSGVELNQIQEVDLEAFGGTRAKYLFNYNMVTMPRHSKHTASYDSSGDPIESTVSVPLLQSVTLPDLSQFQMTYIQSVADQRNVFEEPGMIRSLTLPTLGRYEWEYSLYTFPEQQPEEPGELEPPQPWSTGEGVRFKRVFDRGGTLLGQWAYQQGGRPPTQPAPPPIDGAGALEVRTWVTDPHGHDTVHYFQNDPADFGYGLPFTKLLTDGTGTRFLSRESFQGSATGGASSLLRTEYLRYENDPAAFSGNERIAAQRTVYHDDGGRTADVAFSDFDGHGHYRTATTGGTFGAGDVRTTFTDYNPDRGTLGQAGFTAWPATDPWVLETFTEQRVTEGGQSVVRQTCFDPATGVLLAERLLAGASPGSADVLRSYTYDTVGSLIREEHAGGDVQTVGTSADLCLVTPPSAQYVLRHATQNGVRAKTESLDGTRVLLTSLDQDIDASTGLPAVTRDPAGQATTFTYDLMGRVVREEPPGGEAPRVTVFDKAGLGPAKITVTREDPVFPGVELQRAEFELDDLGRLAKERHRLPGGVFNQRLTSYTPAGFKNGVTELQPDGTAGTSLRWTFFGYEPFGRVASITAPDGHGVTLDYQGIRQVDRHIQGVATSTTGTEQTATTTETYDRQCRLIAVTQPAGSAGQLVTTSYGYDPANRLTQVSTTAEGVTQLRTFDHDGRGFLLSEQHPEIDGAVLYSDYDALGNVGRKRSGQEAGGGYHTDLGFTYDPAGRLVRVMETGGRVFKEMFYATANASSDLRQGKLFQAKRHNYVPDPANPGVDLHRVVTETFRYEGQGGRLSEKRLRGSDALGAGAASFTQSYTYDPLGNVQDEIYPLCISPRCDGYGPPRVVSYQYDQGALTAIPGWLTSITYRRNGLIKKITHRNGMVDTWGNDLDWMRRPRSIAFSGRSSLNLGTYLYDGAGNIKSIGSDHFAYDLVSRLVKADLSGLGKSQDYTFDAYGNLTSIVTTTGAVPDSRPIGVAPATNRLTGAGYDGAGNVTSLFTLTSLTYDPFNRVTQMTGTGVNRSFLYDTSDNRVAILDHQASTEEWLLRGLHEKVVRSFLAKPEGWSWEQDWVYREGQLVASSAPGRWREYHLDHLGTPRLVTGPIGLKEAEYHPFPFGEMASESGPAMEAQEGLFRYTGHQRDTNCEGCAEEAQDDLDYMLARFYSPTVGRFLSIDPIPGALSSPNTWNAYSYVESNPLALSDPTGLIGIAITPDARDEVCEIAGEDCDRVQFAADGTFTVKATAAELEVNEGLALLNEVASSEKVFGVVVGTSVETADGVLQLGLPPGPRTRSLVAVNFTSTPDDRKRGQELPPAGFDGVAAVFSGIENARFDASPNPKPVDRTLVLFHELVENFLRTEKAMQYRQAHPAAQERERALRQQRPDLDKAAPGGGPFTSRNKP